MTGTDDHHPSEGGEPQETTPHQADHRETGTSNSSQARSGQADANRQDARTEALPITRELPATQPLPTAMQPGATQPGPHEAGGDHRPPPVVPPQVEPAAAAGDARPEAADTRTPRSPSMLPWALLIAAVVAVALAIIASSLWTLANNRGGQALAISPSYSATAAATAEPPGETPSVAPSPTPSMPPAEEKTREVSDDSGPPGPNGACSSEIVSIDADDDEFEVKIRIDARAGGVDGWEAEIDLDGAALTDADKVELISHSGDLYTVAGKGKAATIDSGKSITFKVEAEGPLGDIAVGCHA
ncbi:hypothetical protein [Demequina sp. NBRC 110052]|uniref:hypothetical protein n=1 Tax=Demequina sp. NBRC 110052 TaxID=1570341 RepID=UPI000A053017|nr:hypothetical protein [Demequina sp. NBRC 110052]